MSECARRPRGARRAKQRSARRVAHATLTRSMVPTDAGNRQCGAPARYEERSSVSSATVEPRRHIVSGFARCSVSRATVEPRRHIVSGFARCWRVGVAVGRVGSSARMARHARDPDGLHARRVRLLGWHVSLTTCDEGIHVCGSEYRKRRCAAASRYKPHQVNTMSHGGWDVCGSARCRAAVRSEPARATRAKSTQHDRRAPAVRTRREAGARRTAAATPRLRLQRASAWRAGRRAAPRSHPFIPTGLTCTNMTSLVGTMKHVSTLSRKIVIHHTMSRPCRARVANVA